MKKKLLILSLLIVLAVVFIGCSDEEKENSETKTEKIEAFKLSSIEDITGEDKTRTYNVYAPYTDTYTIKGTSNVTSIKLVSENESYEQISELSATLNKNDIYQLIVETEEANEAFELETVATNNLVTYPYDVLGYEIDDSIETNVDAKIEYTKRPGGTYIYSNNPELVPEDSVGTAFIRTKDLTGEVFFTFEHANYSGNPFYLGYQIKNDSDEDVFITVDNIGYQVGGTWFGQLAWYDFYNTSFNLPDDYLNDNGTISSKYSSYDYAYKDYNPRVFQPTTYRLPAGEYFYVIGGTSNDAYNNINVDGTANKKVQNGQCTNGNVKFNVTGGSVTATFYCYTKSAQVKAEPEAVGYRLGKYSQQYVGTANHSGVIDSHITWAFDDSTSGILPVTYTTNYNEKSGSTKKAYEAYENMIEVTYKDLNNWMTHLNPQNDHYAIGHDIVEFSCVDEKGREVVIDNYHSDGIGNAANTANWMIEYQETYTLINRGKRNRTISLYKNDGGTLAVLIRNSQTGEVIDTYYTIGQAVDSPSFTYRIKVPAGATVQITL